MHILVTRPLPDAWETKAKLESLGHQVTLAPLIEIAPNDLTPDDFAGASGIIVTSQNGLRSLTLSGIADSVRRLQIYCVGEATAKLAEAMKLPNITAGRGTAEDLVPVIAERHKTRPGPLVHLAGDHLAYDLKGALAAEGIEVRPVTAYRAIAACELPPDAIGGLRTGRVGVVTLMSPRTADIWLMLAAKHGLQGQLKKLVHVCLSDAVAARLQLEGEGTVLVAAEPKFEEMLSLIKGLAASSA